MLLSASLRFLLAVQWTATARAWGSRLIPRASTPSPISIAPSQNWDGYDGPWSSFTLQVGAPVQNVRVFVSTTSPNTWVVRSDACRSSDVSCEESRGRTFNPETSNTWHEHGAYQLGFGQILGLRVQGVFGNDTLGLGIQGSGGPILEDQIVAAYTSESLYLGMFGTNPSSTNFSATDLGRPSYMSTLKTENLIPSLSFGYTAGNQYRLKQVYGSLTLGGYDSSLFTPNSLTIPFGEDPLRNLLVRIQSISAKDQSGTISALLPTPITADVDSTIPMIWLPREACQAFETAFNLTWDEQTDLYLVSDELHEELERRNASVTFTLGDPANGGEMTDIVLPYDSFDLRVQPPFSGVSESQRYFPLRRAWDEAQFTLGRTFLQEAYLTVDWERRNFSISQCNFLENAQQKLVAIPSITSSTSSGLSTGAKIGIAVGVVIAIVLIILPIAAYLVQRRRKARRADAAAAEMERNNEEFNGRIRQDFLKGELGTGFDNTRFEMQGSDAQANSPHGNQPGDWTVNETASRYPAGDHTGLLAEVEGGDVRPEMAAAAGAAAGEEKTPSFIGRGVHEMYDPSSIPITPPAPAPAPIELPANSHPREEMEGSIPATSSPTSPSSRRRSSLIPAHFLPTSSHHDTKSSSPNPRSSNNPFPQPLPNDPPSSSSSRRGSSIFGSFFRGRRNRALGLLMGKGPAPSQQRQHHQHHQHQHQQQHQHQHQHHQQTQQQQQPPSSSSLLAQHTNSSTTTTRPSAIKSETERESAVVSTPSSPPTAGEKEEEEEEEERRK